MISGGRRPKAQEAAELIFNILGAPATYRKSDGTSRQVRAIVRPMAAVPVGRRPIPAESDGFEGWSREELIETVLALREIVHYLHDKHSDVLLAFRKGREGQLVGQRPIHRKLLADYKQANPPIRAAWCRQWCKDHPAYRLSASQCARIIGARLAQEGVAPRPVGRPKKNTAAR